jgi:hypothetical protein
VLRRRLNTFHFNWVVNSPRAVLSVHNSVMIDPVCNATTAEEDLKAAQGLPQLPSQRRNMVSTAPPFCADLPTGKECFDSGVLMHALSVVGASASRQNRDIATTPAQAAAATAAGHFIVQYHNTTRVCRRYLDPQCLQKNGGNRTVCWEQAARVLALSAERSSSGIAPGVIAGAVVGGERMLVGAVLTHDALRHSSSSRRVQSVGAEFNHKVSAQR